MSSLIQSLESLRVEAILWAQDITDSLMGRKDPLIPPRRLMFDGPRDPKIFKANGEEFLRYYLDLCHLQPDEVILDIGCGIGRKTIPLTGYLSQAGNYVGLDVNKQGIDWCQKHITTRFPQFQFQHIDVYSSRYNPDGRYQAQDYQFPFAADSFDFVTLSSVFTHMFAEGVGQYLSEIARLLKPSSGRSLISYFLIIPEAQRFLEVNFDALQFPVKRDGYYLKSDVAPEDAVAFDEEYIRSLYHSNGLEIEEIYYGSWCGRKAFLSYQDLIVARKA